MEPISLNRARTVTGDGDGLVSRAGLVWAAEAADLTGLSAGIGDAFDSMAWRSHRPGRTMALVVLGLADGATCLTDLAVLRNQPALAGPVASEATVWRTFNSVGPAELRGLTAARATARERAWAAGAGPDGDRLVIDIDATIVRTRADKQDAAPTTGGPTGTTRCWPWPATAARSWPGHCARATPGPTPPRTT